MRWWSLWLLYAQLLKSVRKILAGFCVRFHVWTTGSLKSEAGKDLVAPRRKGWWLTSVCFLASAFPGTHWCYEVLRACNGPRCSPSSALRGLIHVTGRARLSESPVTFLTERIDGFPCLHWIRDASGLCQEIRLKCPMSRTVFKEYFHFGFHPVFED